MTTAHKKALSNLALIIGLIEHIKEAYKSKTPQRKCELIIQKTHKALTFWPGDLTQREIEKIHRRVLRLGEYLDKKPARTLTSCALGILSDMMALVKQDKRQVLADINITLFSLHKYLDKNLNHFDDYQDAKKALAVWGI